MRKIIAVLLCSLLILMSVSAVAEYNTLRAVQEYIFSTPTGAMKEIPITLTGTIDRIEYAYQSNHFNFFILVDEEKAVDSIAERGPGFIAHVRIHDPYIQFERGQQITVSGRLNPQYSSFITPYVIVNAINGSEEY